jgi:hypothetical protein
VVVPPPTPNEEGDALLLSTVWFGGGLMGGMALVTSPVCFISFPLEMVWMGEGVYACDVLSRTTNEYITS